MVRLLQEKEPPAESSEIDAVFSEKRRSSSLESEVFVGDDAVTGGSRQELQTLTCYHQSLLLRSVSGEDWRWSSTDLRKQRRHRPFTSSLKIRSCLKSRQLRIDPRLPPLPLPELYLRVVIGRDSSAVEIGSCIFEATKIPCQSNEFVHELLRGVRQHFDRFIKDLKVIEDKSKLSEEHIPMLTDILGDEDKAKEILGAEKALFRALKTRGNTPKYGLIFHSSFIGRASAKNKGRIARYLANKCSVASRIDCFADSSTTAFGEKLREQVEEPLEFYDKGVAPRKNVDVMKEVLESLEKKDEGEAIAVEASEKNKKKDKRKTEEKDEGEDGEKSTKKKKSKTVEEELTSHRRKRRKLSHKVKNIPRQVSVM
ncbi:hypothetical protein Bca4012_074430 [Brassica carinata]